jgi:hypothetical protein
MALADGFVGTARKHAWQIVRNHPLRPRSWRILATALIGRIDCGPGKWLRIIKRPFERLTVRLSDALRWGCRNEAYLRRSHDLIRRLCAANDVDVQEVVVDLSQVVRGACAYSRARKVRSTLKAALAYAGLFRVVHAFYRRWQQIVRDAG